jgi:hypothetical protein
VIQKIKTFFTSQGITSHSIAAGMLVVIGAYHQVPQFHDLVTTVYGKLGPTFKEIVASAVALVAWYWNTKKPGGNA